MFYEVVVNWGDGGEILVFFFEGSVLDEERDYVIDVDVGVKCYGFGEFEGVEFLWELGMGVVMDVVLGKV